MKEKDLYQQMDAWLREKPYAGLSEKERGIVAELGYTPEEYDLLHRSKQVLATSPSSPAGWSPALHSAVRSNRSPGLLACRIPLWQAAAVTLLLVGLQWLWLPSSPEKSTAHPVVICQTDTLRIERLVHDTLRLFLPAPTLRIEPDTGSSAIALDSTGHSEGIPIKEQPELKQFFTETF